MSDTPKTDFQKALVACVEYRAKLAELERENATLRADVYCCLPTTENDYEGFKWRDAHEELERENAALRANSKEVFEYEAQMEELKSENTALREALVLIANGAESAKGIAKVALGKEAQL